MATRIESPQLVVPAGTAIAAPVSKLLFQYDGIVDEIRILVPPGPSGLVGFAIFHSSQQIIPYVNGEWVIADGQEIIWPLTGYSTEAGWKAKAYNLDVYDHTLYFTIMISELQSPSSLSVAAIVPIG